MARKTAPGSTGLLSESHLDLSVNPIDQVQRSAPEVAEAIDLWVVLSSAQVAELLSAVRAQGCRGEHLAGRLQGGTHAAPGVILLAR